MPLKQRGEWRCSISLLPILCPRVLSGTQKHATWREFLHNCPLIPITMQGTALSETGHAKVRFLLTPMQSRFSDVSFVIQANCWKHLCDLADGFSVTFNSTTKQIANHDYQSTFLVRWQRRSHWLTKWSEILILSALQRLLSHLKKKKNNLIQTPTTILRIPNSWGQTNLNP